jgi:hypothetical protein
VCMSWNKRNNRNNMHGATVKILYRNFFKGTEENQDKTVRLLGVLVKIRTRLLPSVRLEQGCLTSMAQGHSHYCEIFRGCTCKNYNKRHK